MRRATLLLLGVIPLAACGGGANVASGPEGAVKAPSGIADRGTATAGSGPIVMRMGEDWFRPTIVRGPAGSRVSIELENVGYVAHSFDVSGDGQRVDVIVQPGRRATVHVRIPTIGRLLFFCKLHWSRGMAGYLEPA